MKTILKTLALCAFIALGSSSAHAQLDEIIFINSGEAYLKKDMRAQPKSFLSVHAEGSIYLTWVVSNLKNDGTFLICRSSDGEYYEIIGIRQSAGTRKKMDIAYFFIDENPVIPGIMYYKIIHFGTDNLYFTSNILKIEFPVKNLAVQK